MYSGLQTVCRVVEENECEIRDSHRKIAIIQDEKENLLEEQEQQEDVTRRLMDTNDEQQEELERLL